MLAGWTLTEALDISDNGNVIVGYAYNPAGQSRGFVVVIPEPDGLLLAIMALVLGAAIAMRPRT